VATTGSLGEFFVRQTEKLRQNNEDFVAVAHQDVTLSKETGDRF
jgi:hypothetical protein